MDSVCLDPRIVALKKPPNSMPERLLNTESPNIVCHDCTSDGDGDGDGDGHGDGHGHGHGHGDDDGDDNGDGFRGTSG